MPNTVARPILAINAIPVNKDFREGERRDRNASVRNQGADESSGWTSVCLYSIMFAQIRDYKESPGANHSQTAKSIGLHQALF